MKCEKYMILTVLMLVCLIDEMASEPRWAWGRRRRSCQKTNCVPGPWSAWSSCSATCGPHGAQYTRRSIKVPAKCGGSCLVTTHGGRACNRFCLNGGTLIRTSCHCKYGYSGVCCEKGSGGWSSWGEWCPCSKTCGRGSQNRKRTCNKPGGVSCPGSPTEYRSCLVKQCNIVNGGWSNWGAWGTCSKTCGSGFQYSRRYCNNPTPGYGGKMCVGESIRTRACSVGSCKKDGGWSSWSSWGQCTGSCGTGLQTRKRTCTNPPPGYGGKKCAGRAEEHKNCLLKRCPITGRWSPWSKWRACSKPCGTGSQYRTRTCTRPPPAYGGKHCTGPNRQTRECNKHICPVHGGWSNWGNWGTCTKTCGNGKQYSRRRCDNPAPKYGGKKCYGTDVRTRACNVRPCPVNGRWTRWAAWSACTKTCGTGSQVRRRTCTNPPPKHGGKCNGPSAQTKYCVKQKCPTNGGWGSWGKWGACSKTCGTGTQYRSRYCNKPRPAYGGKTCPGQNRESRRCRTNPCPVNGRWSQWGDWCKCSKTCGTGNQNRKRTCSNPPPQHGGKQCKGPSEQTKSCLLKQCPAYGGWGSWGKWSACSKTCGTGTQNRKRKCEGYSGNCAGSNEETRHCNTQKCPAAVVDGGWGDWSDWSACSESCGPGSSIRSRQCNNPAPGPGGKPCTGHPVSSKSCNEGSCPVDGGWGDWSDWSACSVSCGPGSSIRSRKCNNPAPSSGGKQCTGLPVSSKSCNEGSCPVDGGWGDWSNWSACSVSCGPGTSIRSRQCNNPPPGPGGKPCTGLPVSNKPCNEGSCPGSEDCWGDWSDWSPCDKACNCGKTYRVRFCKCAHGQGHDQCQGPGDSSKSCNCHGCPNGPPSDDVVEG
ncbi:SCO-spondin-like isoform X1 [Oculina patagonica]